MFGATRYARWYGLGKASPMTASTWFTWADSCHKRPQQVCGGAEAIGAVKHAEGPYAPRKTMVQS